MAREPKIILRWDGEKAVPAAPVDRWALQKLGVGQLLEADPHKPKSNRAVRYLHALLKIAEDNSLGWKSEAIKTQVKLANGWITGATVKHDGEIYCELRSLTSFDREELDKFIEQVRAFILEEVCPGLDPKLLEREIDQGIAERRG